MDSFLKKVITKKVDPDTKRYFLRFGKGNYKGRFLVKVDVGPVKIKLRTSYEFANDIVRLMNELNNNVKFSGKILTKEKIPGKVGRKKAGVLVYELEECNIKEYPNAYYYLLDSVNQEMILKIKKALPKPGQDESKIDDKFCSLDLDLKYLNVLKDTFLWDVPEGKKILIEHELHVNQIDIPVNEKDPVKVRENAIRRGKLIRKISVDGKDVVKDYDLTV